MIDMYVQVPRFGLSTDFCVRCTEEQMLHARHRKHGTHCLCLGFALCLPGTFPNQPTFEDRLPLQCYETTMSGKQSDMDGSSGRTLLGDAQHVTV